MTPSIVIPYRKSSSDELIYCLRSLKNIRHGKVFIIGDKPEGINLEKVTYIYYPQTSDIAKNTHEILTLACNTEEVTDNFIWQADDMYYLRKIYHLPVFHRGYYDDLLGKYAYRVSNFYVKRARDTNAYLKSLGIEKPFSYEVHIPFMINKQKWLDLNLEPKYNKLSVYGNVYNIGGYKLQHDVKVRTRDWVPSGSFASSYDATFGSNSLGKKVKGLFPDRSQYEI